jgi:hypothetical protein
MRRKLSQTGTPEPVGAVGSQNLLPDWTECLDRNLLALERSNRLFQSKTSNSRVQRKHLHGS